MLGRLESIGVDGKTAEKTSQLKRQLKKQLLESADINAWCESIIATNKELDNIVDIEPAIEFVEIPFDEEEDSYDFSDENAIFKSFGFCGCSTQEEALAFMRKGLAHIKFRRDADDDEAIEQDEMAVFGSQGAATFFYYWADTQNLIDHGSAVPGWLDYKGELLLSRLNELGY
jgi:hypothetical protein